ncbi:ankyrin repeat domain-containing protein [Turneriella parva]|uniref:Ankyrin n=1 Tax=Turneriella parva (strain ATCC BAA-1111 / DSM 21527 / NCTC 11395 / H) TaxID=869212 RepID=I4B8F2_TURPD|nr:ankyrin repeat domain-containing protein [Turneriella parva]AFM13559.1 Ankyrin [Turneriella parva DSM 21527]
MIRKTGLFLILTIFTVLSAQTPSPQERLESAVYSDNAAEIKAAIKAGAGANSGNYSGHFLGIAATRGTLKSVQALVEAGADVNYSTSGGWTAAMAAADNGHLPVLKYLVSKKADLNARTRMGRTLLMRAAYHGQTAVVQYLLSKGAKVNEPDQGGVTALMLAAQQGHDATVKALLAAGADKALVAASQKNALALAREGETANAGYRAEEFKRTIALLSGAESRSKGKLIGKVFRAEGKKIEITGSGIKDAKRGARIIIKTDSGDIKATVGETLHSKIKATAVKKGAEKGDSVYLEK